MRGKKISRALFEPCIEAPVPGRALRIRTESAMRHAGDIHTKIDRKIVKPGNPRGESAAKREPDPSFEYTIFIIFSLAS